MATGGGKPGLPPFKAMLLARPHDGEFVGIPNSNDPEFLERIFNYIQAEGKNGFWIHIWDIADEHHPSGSDEPKNS